MNDAAAIYQGTVMHRRAVAPCYRFVYRTFSLWLDIDRIDQLDRLRLLSVDRFNLFGFYRKDHGPRDGGELRAWAESHLRRQGVELAGGEIRLFCMPRFLGYGFNPLSLWFCHHHDGSLRAIIAEVRNTFGDYHSYLIHEHGAPLPYPVRAHKHKQLYVSPFLPMTGRYRFRFAEPGARFSLVIQQFGDAGLQLVAAQQGERQALDDLQLFRLAWRIPFQSIKVMAAIHWQALKIWLRGGTFHRRPEPPREETS